MPSTEMSRRIYSAVEQTLPPELLSQRYSEPLRAFSLPGWRRRASSLARRVRFRVE